jgi:voltage-gated potassium channel
MSATIDATGSTVDELAVRRFEQRTEWPMAVLAVLFLAVFAWPILEPGLEPSLKRACVLTAYLIWALFALEFLCRLALANRRMRYAWRHIPDVLMIALPVLRPLRLLRLLVLIRMINRRATASLRGQVIAYVAASTALVLLCASLAMLDAERHNPAANIHSFGDALWWAASTMTTAGYGDRVPTTGEGRAVGFALMLAGIALLGVVTAAIASWLIDRVRDVDAAAQAATRGDIAALRAEIAMLRQALTGPDPAAPPTPDQLAELARSALTPRGADKPDKPVALQRTAMSYRRRPDIPVHPAGGASDPGSGVVGE